MVKPNNGRPEDPEMLQRREELNQRSAGRLGKIAAMLSANYYITDWTHPVLAMGDSQLSVSEYYPTIKTAVDKFYSYDPDEKEIHYKRKALKEIGVKYAYVTLDSSLVDLYSDLGAQQ